MRRMFVLYISLAALAAAMPTQAELALASIFGDHMVLQQGRDIAVWGTADAGAEVWVKIGGHEKRATTCEDGKWMVNIPRMQTGAAQELTVTSGDDSITLKDVLIGEVWIGSGQSNMQWSVAQSANPEAEIAAANHPEIRLFYVERTVATEPLDAVKGSWQVCTPETISEFSAVLYYFGRELHQNLNIPVGLIHTSWGGTPAEAWTSREALLANPDLAHIVANWDKTVADYPAAKAAYDMAIAEWQKAAEAAKAAGQPEPKKPGEPQGPQSSWLAGGLYNAMIAPLVPFTIRGAVWYQGESNAGRAYQYRTLFPAMIQDWRDKWGYDFSFYFVQLANFTETKPEPGDSDWAELREAQTMTLSLPNTGMATIIDIGEAADIHPKNKQDVGKRLALNALRKDYGKHVAHSGPMLSGQRVRGDEIVLRFDHTDGGLVAKDGEELKGFAIAGVDKKFVWADAKIRRNTVVVSSPEVSEPVAVRYGWANNPVCNLYNGAGLPASPFRTDDWPGVTVNNK